MLYSFDFERRVDYVETDKMGVMHNSIYFWFFEKYHNFRLAIVGFWKYFLVDNWIMVALQAFLSVD